ncbi:hypothetical protein ACFZBC_09560 [Streptomyces luteogriseus]|uniref:hypothetical protein n=1 Tax=Streptomyces luteogriseus TaxID=68233 RepID=UPI0036E95B1E
MISIWNNHTVAISAAIEWAHPNCDGSDWEKTGWYNIEPGTTQRIWKGDHNFNRWWYGYVFAVDGRDWTGPFPETVPWKAFRSCASLSSTAHRVVNMFERDAAGSGGNWVWVFGNVIPV